MVCDERRFTLIIARRLGLAILRALVGVIHLVAIAAGAAIYVPAAILILLIGLVSLALMAVEDADGNSHSEASLTRRQEYFEKLNAASARPGIETSDHWTFRWLLVSRLCTR